MSKTLLERTIDLELKMEEDNIRSYLKISAVRDKVNVVEKKFFKLEALLESEDNTFNWRTENFSTVCRQLAGGQYPYLQSEDFTRRGYTMCVRMRVGDSGQLGVFLHTRKGLQNSTLSWPIAINFQLSFLDQSGCPLGNRQDITAQCKFIAAHRASQKPLEDVNPEGVGHPEIVPVHVVNDAPYLERDTLIVQVKTL